MRKAILALAACAVLATSSPAWAQSAGASVMLGVNFANINLSPSNAIQVETRTGLAVGLFVTRPVAQQVSLEVDVLYSQKGANMSKAGASVTVDVDYLDIPVLARITAGAGPTKLAIVAGPSFGFRMRAHGKVDIGGQTVDDEDIGSDVSSFDFGFIVGGGVDTGKFLLDGRYQGGLSNASKMGFVPVDTMKNRVFSILVGVRL